MDITDFIKELNEDYISNIDDLDEIKESNISNFTNITNNTTKKKMRYIKTEIIKKMFLEENDSKKVIHWRLGDIVTKEIYQKNNKNGILLKRSSFAKLNLNDPKFQSAYLDSSRRNIKSSKISVKSLKKKRSVGVSTNVDNETMKIKQLQLQTSSTEEKLPNINPEKIIDIKDELISEINQESSFIVNDKNSKDKFYYHRPVHHKFTLSVNEVKFNEVKIGYIFRLEPYSSKKLDETNIVNKNNQYNSKYDLSSVNKQEINDIEKSEISLISFAGNSRTLEHKNSMINNPENPFGISCENNDSFFLKINNEKENEFTIDMGKMSYKQMGINDKSAENELFELLRQEAVEKISKIARSVKKEDLSEEEEEEESSGSSNSNEEEKSSNTSEIDSPKKYEEKSSIHSAKEDISLEKKSSQKIENNGNVNKTKTSPRHSNKNLPLITNTTSSKNNNINLNQLNIINNNLSNKHKDDDEYYHVDVSKITYYIYNFNSGFVEAIKDQKYKISQVVKQKNAEKEKLSKVNSKLIANPKLVKDKKKGGGVKKIINDGDELNLESLQTIKLKEIQKALTSKEKQHSIINLCIFSFFIFIIVIGSGVISIIINNSIKDTTYQFYELIKNSILLYKNILYEITLVRELIIMNSTYYNDNFYDKNKTRYFVDHTTKCYQYFIDTTLILSNLTIKINTLNEKQRHLLGDKTVECFVLSSLNRNDTEYQPLSYEIKAYSAYKELNSALYHISKLEMNKIATFEDNVYYFIKNGMSNLLIYAENQIKVLTEEFNNIIQNGYTILIICFVVLFVVYVICFFIFNHFYEKVEERKQSYLSVFYEIDLKYITLSLEKCEKFSQKLQMQEENSGNFGDKLSLDSSYIENVDIDNDIQISSLIKQNKENKIKTKIKDKKTKNNILIKVKIIGIIIFFILFVFQLSSYVYYYIRLSLYKNCIQYEYHLTEYMSTFLFPFIGIREYIYEKQKYFRNIPVYQYIDDTLGKFYVKLSEISDNKDKYIQYFPQSYTDYLNYLYSDQINILIHDFIDKYPRNGFNSSVDFFYGSSYYGFFTILTIYIEEIRMLRDTVNDYNEKAVQKKYIYNESFLNDPNGFYEKEYDKYKDVSEDYKKLNPVNTLNTRSHKTIVIVYQFVISKVIVLALDQLFFTFEGIFNDTTKVSLIINIVFVVVVTIGFCLIWLPFVLEENETIFKTKNMLSIIPNDILISLPHINNMLGIDEENT